MAFSRQSRQNPNSRMELEKESPAYTEICKVVSHQEEVERGTEFVENEDGVFYDFEDHMHRFYLTTEWLKSINCIKLLYCLMTMN